MAQKHALHAAIRTIDVHSGVWQLLLPFFETSALQKITLPNQCCMMAST
jgi:hypothetical protein